MPRNESVRPAHGVDGGVAGVRGKKRVRIITPIVEQPFAGQRIPPPIARFVELVDRQQFDRRDAQRLEIGDFFDQPREGAGMFDARTLIDRHAPYVALVNDGFPQRAIERLVEFPIEFAVDDDGVLAVHFSPLGQGVVLVIDIVPRPPTGTAGNRPRIGIEQHLIVIELVNVVVRPLHAIAVLDADVDAADERVPDLSGAVVVRIQRKLGNRIPFAGDEKNQRHARGMF